MKQYSGPPRSGHFWLHVFEVLTVVLALVVAVLVGVHVGATSRSTVKDISVRAAAQAASATNPACSPQAGKGHIGVCAPTQAYAVANLFAKDSGDPDTITSPVGVDVSNNNGCDTSWMGTSWLKFAYFKASESTKYTDGCVRGFVSAAKTRGLPFGLYDFLRPGYSSASAEAAYFVAVVRAVGGTELPPVADVEVSDGQSPTVVRAYVATWVAVVRADLHVTPDVYTAEGFWNQGVGGGNDGAGLWAADWANTLMMANAWTRYEFWQYASSGFGPKPWYRGWDMDTFNGTVTQLRALAGLVVAKPAVKPPVTPTVTIPAPPAPSTKGRCFGHGATPNSGVCRVVLARWHWLVARRTFWGHEFNRCIRYADGIRCGRADRWFHVRGSQAAKLRKKYS